MSRGALRGMVLAAGFGTRLRPLTDRVPKPLIEVGGRPMIEYPLRMLAAAGIREVIVNLHHLGDPVRAALGDGTAFGLSLRYSYEDPILDTGGGIARARGFLDGGDFVVVNCDALLDADLGALVALHRGRGALATLVLREDRDAERYGAVDVDDEGRIRRFLGRGEAGGRGLRRRMFCGVHVLSPTIFTRMPREPVFSITRDVYASAVAAGEPLFGLDHIGYWHDLGTPQTLARASEDLESGAFSPRYLTGGS